MSMCMPQLHPSIYLGVLAMVMGGVSGWSMVEAICLSEYHWREVEWMSFVTGGGR